MRNERSEWFAGASHEETPPDPRVYDEMGSTDMHKAESMSSRNLRPHAASVVVWLVQTFGLDPRAAVLMVVVDLMGFCCDTLSLGALIIPWLIAAAVLGLVVYRIQIHWYGDDHDSALIKSMIIGLLTAIPVPLTPLIAVPCGIVGLARATRIQSTRKPDGR